MPTLALQLIAENKISKDTRLDLGNCGLTELPKKLFELEWLEELVVSNEWWDWEKEERHTAPTTSSLAAKIMVIIPYLMEKMIIFGSLKKSKDDTTCRSIFNYTY